MLGRKAALELWKHLADQLGGLPIVAELPLRRGKLDPPRQRLPRDGGLGDDALKYLDGLARAAVQPQRRRKRGERAQDGRVVVVEQLRQILGGAAQATRGLGIVAL